MSYEQDLENLIMDELLPIYLVGCRSLGIKSDTNKILKKLMEIRRSRRKLPALLNRDFSKLDQS